MGSRCRRQQPCKGRRHRDQRPFQSNRFVNRRRRTRRGLLIARRAASAWSRVIGRHRTAPAVNAIAAGAAAAAKLQCAPRIVDSAGIAQRACGGRETGEGLNHQRNDQDVMHGEVQEHVTRSGRVSTWIQLGAGEIHFRAHPELAGHSFNYSIIDVARHGNEGFRLMMSRWAAIIRRRHAPTPPRCAIRGSLEVQRV